jgi:hypothetical protein
MFNLFGPSKFDRMLDILREDRAATMALMTALVDSTKAQADLAAKQLALLTAPTDAPRVHVMTPAVEAAYERQRNAAAKTPTPGTTIVPDTLLAALTQQFAEDDATYDRS